VEYVLSAVEFVAERGEAFVPLYRLDWRDGVWRHLEREVTDPGPQLSGAALARSASGPPEPGPPPPAPEEVAAERARTLREAARLAEELEARWRAHPPRWNAPIGRADLDGLVWFRYVETTGL
jgi:hypothetical protein